MEWLLAPDFQLLALIKTPISKDRRESETATERIIEAQ
jgi:hypothetical protein